MRHFSISSPIIARLNGLQSGPKKDKREIIRLFGHEYKNDC